jgi:hypothetical protein
MSDRYTMIDGLAQHHRHPTTFAVPPPQALAALKAGDFVKIGVNFDPHKKQGDDPPARALVGAQMGADAAARVDGERFWVELTEVTAETLSGVVNNDLVYTAHHGLACGDAVTLRRSQVLSILETGQALTDKAGRRRSSRRIT